MFMWVACAACSNWLSVNLTIPFPININKIERYDSTVRTMVHHVKVRDADMAKASEVLVGMRSWLTIW